MGQYTTDENLAKRIAIHQYSVNPQPWGEWYLSNVRFRPGIRILDIGCGNGFLWRGNEHLVAHSSEIILADFSEGMITSAREALTGAGPNWSFVTADVGQLPFAANSFDLVMANHMLYHAKEVEPAIAELARVLRPGGTLFASTNGNGHMAELRGWIRHFGVDEDIHLQAHIRRFGLENGGDLLGRHFGTVNLLRHEDSLEVPAVEPVVAYIRSMRPPENQATEIALAELRAMLDRLLVSGGTIRIRKESGLFVASDPA